MGTGMTADITAFVDRIIATSKIIGIKINQMGVGRGCRPTDQGHTVGIVTEETGHALANYMGTMARKGGLKLIEQDHRIVTAKTEGVVALGIA